MEEEYSYLGKTSKVKNEYSEMVQDFLIGSKLFWRLEMRIYDDGVSFRYILPPDYNEKFRLRIFRKECTTIGLNEGLEFKYYYQKNLEWYEGIFEGKEYFEIPETTIQDYKYPFTEEVPMRIGLPVTFKSFSGPTFFGMISESHTTNFTGSSLRKTFAGVEGDDFFDFFYHDDPDGFPFDSSQGLYTSWKNIHIGTSLNELFQSNLVINTSPPPNEQLFGGNVLQHSNFIKPGKTLWQWWAYDSPGTLWENQFKFIDYAIQLGMDYYLVDEGWENPEYGWFSTSYTLLSSEGKRQISSNPFGRLKELCEYASSKERPIGIWVWRSMNSSKEKYWPGLETKEKRREFFQILSSIEGVVGVKIDFIHSESHVRQLKGFYEDCLVEAAKNQLMVNFHGCAKPTGLERTFPNEMTREGVMGLEHNRIDVTVDLPPSHYVLATFSRFVVGNGDFTPMTLQESRLRGTTVVFQMATVIIFSSPVLVFADKPTVYLQHPQIVELFMKKVPTVWDSTYVLEESEIEELAGFVRKKGDEVWCGIINGNDNKRKFMDISLSQILLLDEDVLYDVTIFEDVVSIDKVQPTLYSVKFLKGVKRRDVISVSLEVGGGFIAIFNPME